MRFVASVQLIEGVVFSFVFVFFTSRLSGDSPPPKGNGLMMFNGAGILKRFGRAAIREAHSSGRDTFDAFDQSRDFSIVKRFLAVYRFLR